MNQDEKFQEQQNQILKFLMQKLFFDKWSQYSTSSRINNRNTCLTNLELFITPTCNQKCDYCYLNKYSDVLYPENIRDEKTILSNLEILLDYLIKNHYQMENIHLFSGEIWGTTLGRSVLDIILKKIQEGLHIQAVIIPSNFSFVLSDNALNQILRYVELYKQTNVELAFSASVDGLVVEDEERPFVSQQKNLRDTDFYDRVAKLVFNVPGWGFHPMIDSLQIKNQIDNYEWWKELFIKYNKFDIVNWTNYLMFLEVRNDSWSGENIKDYLKWLNYVFDQELTILWKNDILSFLKDRIFSPSGGNYHPLEVLHQAPQLGCSVGDMLIVRLGDLSILPCHRLAYNKLIYGHFKVEDGQITDIIGQNPVLMNSIMGQGTSLMFKCSDCPVREICMKGCLGSQYETSGELFKPNDTVCDFFKAKYIFLYLKITTIIREDENLYTKINSTDQYRMLKTSVLELLNSDKEMIKWVEEVKKIL